MSSIPIRATSTRPRPRSRSGCARFTRKTKSARCWCRSSACKVSSRKFFPGYIFVQMVLDDETWHVIKNTPKITGFVGHSTNPPEVPVSEVAEIEQQMEEGALRPKPKVLF